MKMFDVNRESLLDLMDTMKGRVEVLDFNNPLEVYVFASSLISIGNSICLSLVKELYKKK